MNGQSFRRVEEIFQAACGLPDAERPAYLLRACDGDAALRSEVESLLRRDDELEHSSVLVGIEHGVAREAAAALAARDGHPERIGPYRILDRLGSGGMGVVYRAEQESPRRIVALKVIQPLLAGSAAARRFELEAQVLGRLQHPGIAQVHHAGLAEGAGGRVPYFAMELIEGKTLGDYARAGALTTEERLELLARICDAVHHAHQKGVIHRDLKPGNILVRRGSPRPGEPKVLDFGVARLTGVEARPTEARTLAGQWVGTLPYMSPEQIGTDPEAIDIRSDVYSLGVILYELLSGKLPIDPGAASLPEAARRILLEEPEKLGRHSPRCRGDIETIVSKALEKEPDRRYSSAAELASDIRRTLRDEPISARPASRIYVLGKFARRNRPVVVSTVLLVLALAAGFVAERVQRQNAEDARRALEETNRELEEALRGSEQVTRFLTDLFAEANPRETGGRPVTIREKLLGVQDRLAEFADQPRIESRIRQTIGEACFGIGEVQLAREHLERSLELRRSLHGEESNDTLRAYSALASVLLALGEKEEGLRMAEAAFAGFEELVGIAHEETLTALILVAAGHERLGRPDTEARQRECLELCREHLGPEHPKTLQAASNYAVRLQTLGRSAEAEPLLRQVVEVRRAELGDRHPDTALALNNLGHLLNNTKRYADALPYLEEAYRSVTESLGPVHERTLMFGNNLGVAYYGLERFEEARPFFERAAERSLADLGPAHPNTLHAQGNLAGLLRKSGDLDEALARFPAIIEGLRRAYPAGHPAVATYERIHGLALIDAARYGDAEPLLIGAHESLKKALGPDHSRTAEARASVAQLYTAWGRPVDAAAWGPSPAKE